MSDLREKLMLADTAAIMYDDEPLEDYRVSPSELARIEREIRDEIVNEIIQGAINEDAEITWPPHGYDDGDDETRKEIQP